MHRKMSRSARPDENHGVYSQIEHRGDRQTSGDLQFQVHLCLGRKITSNILKLRIAHALSLTGIWPR